MDKTPQVSISLMAPNQAAKHIVFNEAVIALDGLLHLSFVQRDVDDPPEAPVDGSAYLIGETPTGDWSGLAGQVALATQGGWRYFMPQSGWRAYDQQTEESLLYDGTAWSRLDVTAGQGEPVEFPALAVNAGADATNRLTVKSDSVILSHDDQTPGTGDLRLILNKAGQTHTASVLLQSGYSGRAEISLGAEDDLLFRVSSDGQSFQDALRIDAQTGRVLLPQTPVLSAPFNLLGDAGRFAGLPEPTGVPAQTFTFPSYLQTFNGGSKAEGPKFINNNGSYGGTNAALDPQITARMELTKSSPFTRRYGPEFFTLQFTAGAGTAGVKRIDDVDHYLALVNAPAPLPSAFTWNVHVSVVSGSLLVDPLGSDRSRRNGTVFNAPIRLQPADGWSQITHHYQFGPSTFLGYATDVPRLYATPGSVFLIAAPLLCPGRLPIGVAEHYLIVPGLNAWT